MAHLGAPPILALFDQKKKLCKCFAYRGLHKGKKDALRVNFDRKLKLEFHGVKVTSDAGLLAYREIDDAFGLTEMAACELSDNRTGKNTQHRIA